MNQFWVLSIRGVTVYICNRLNSASSLVIVQRPVATPRKSCITYTGSPYNWVSPICLAYKMEHIIPWRSDLSLDSRGKSKPHSRHKCSRELKLVSLFLLPWKTSQLSSVSVKEKQLKPPKKTAMNCFPFSLLFLNTGAHLMWNLDPVYISEHETSLMIKFEEIKSYFNTPILNNLKFHFQKVKTFYVIFIL